MACGDVTADMLRWFMQYLATQQVTAIDIFNFQLSAFCAMTSNMESEHASKRIKLEQLLQFKAKLPAHSQSELEAILQEASKSGFQIWCHLITKEKQGCSCWEITMVDHLAHSSSRAHWSWKMGPLHPCTTPIYWSTWPTSTTRTQASPSSSRSATGGLQAP